MLTYVFCLRYRPYKIRTVVSEPCNPVSEYMKQHFLFVSMFVCFLCMSVYNSGSPGPFSKVTCAFLLQDSIQKLSELDPFKPGTKHYLPNYGSDKCFKCTILIRLRHLYYVTRTPTNESAVYWSRGSVCITCQESHLYACTLYNPFK